MIRYKVVREIDRTSCIVPEYSEYCLKYLKGVVRAIPGTFGIMVFKNEIQAIQFTKANNCILKVRPIGKCRKPDYVSSIVLNSYDLTRFYAFYKQNHRKKYWMTKIPTIYTLPGTECYPAVEVLE